MAGCAGGAAAGGSCGKSAAAGAFSELAGPIIDAGGNHIAYRVTAHAVAGGLGSLAAGGKFENGAVTGAFGYLFNEVGHYGQRGYVGNDIRSAWSALLARPEIAAIDAASNGLNLAETSLGSGYDSASNTIFVDRADLLKQFRTSAPPNWGPDQFERMPMWRSLDINRILAHEAYHSTQDSSGLRYQINSAAYEGPALRFENQFMNRYFGQPYRMDVNQWRWAPWSGK